MKDYYAIIGVNSKASQEEIKRAYRKLAVQFHPDKNADPNAQQLFVEINEAYDVLGDPVKRHLYDQRVENPWREIIVEPEFPRHRDPAYRRKTSPTNAPTASPYSDAYLLMKEYLPYVKWLIWAGLIVTSIFFLDFVLPYHITEEKVVSIEVVRGRRNHIVYYIANTASGKNIQFYGENAEPLFRGADIRWARTLFYATPMWVAKKDGSEKVRLAYMYGALMFVPLTIFIASALALAFRKRIEFCFNVSIVNGVLLLIFWYLI